MKTSAGLFLTDILPTPKTFYSRFVHNDIFGKHPTHYVFGALKEAGVEGVEIFLPSFQIIDAGTILELKKYLDQEHMPAFSLHQAIRFLSLTKIDEIEQLFQFGTILGVEVIVLHIGNAGKQIFTSTYVKAIHQMQNKYGIKVGFENREHVIGTSKKVMYHWHEKEFAKVIRENDLYITLDTTHLGQAGGDILQFYKDNKERIINIHLSDYRHHPLNTTLRPLRYKHMPLGKGELPITAFMELLYKEKYKGLVTMEIHTDLEGMCESARIINRLGKLKKSGKKQL